MIWIDLNWTLTVRKKGLSEKKNKTEKRTGQKIENVFLSGWRCKVAWRNQFEMYLFFNAISCSMVHVIEMYVCCEINSIMVLKFRRSKRNLSELTFHQQTLTISNHGFSAKYGFARLTSAYQAQMLMFKIRMKTRKFVCFEAQLCTYMYAFMSYFHSFVSNI